MYITNCENLITDLKSKSSAKSKTKRIIINFTTITIFSHINMFVSMIIRKKFKISSNKNFIFNSTHNHRLNHEKNILFHIMNVNFSCVHVKNITNISVLIFRLFRLKLIQEYENEECYLISSNDVHLTTEQ